uniref:Uncharacterized protein n=1 Tax=Aegilops tauschii subsp. strangulata TaxID=200361 RepID=A0A453FKV7_AEGTS
MMLWYCYIFRCWLMYMLIQNSLLHMSQKKIFQKLKNQRKEGLSTPTPNSYFMARTQLGTSFL